MNQTGQEDGFYSHDGDEDGDLLEEDGTHYEPYERGQPMRIELRHRHGRCAGHAVRATDVAAGSGSTVLQSQGGQIVSNGAFGTCWLDKTWPK